MPLPNYQAPSSDGSSQPPLSPGYIEGGGTIRLMQRTAPGSYRQLAYINDVTTGIIYVPSLLNLDSITFALGRDKFNVTAGDLNSILDKNWKAPATPDVGNSPYAKARLVNDSMYIFYDTPSGTTKHFQITEIDYDDYENLAGQAVDAAVELAGYFTQYVPGASEFAGSLPSEVAYRNLKGHQSLTPQNRRFIRDSSPSLSIGTALTDQTPLVDASAGQATAPLPLIEELVPTTATDACQFSGIPSHVVPPGGTPRNLESGYVGYLSFNDVTVGVPSATVIANFGSFKTPVLKTKVAAPINWNITGTSLMAGENVSGVSRVLYGAIRADTTGLHQLMVQSVNGHRFYFRGAAISDQMFASGSYITQTISLLTEGMWYPFVIHQGTGPGTQTQLSFEWVPPTAHSYAVVPSTNLSHQMHDGFFCVRFTDVESVVRFVMCYKRWDGQAIVMGYPLPATVWSASVTSGSHWTKSSPVGSLVEEVSFPYKDDTGDVITWGTGWTRKPGPSDLMGPQSETSVMQIETKGY